MSESILDSVKKSLGLPPDYDAFDADVIMHTNTALATLQQIGVGPILGFAIEDDTSTWNEVLGESPRMNMAQSYVYLYVKSLFDPPPTSFHLVALKEQIEKLEWRLYMLKDSSGIEEV